MADNMHGNSDVRVFLCTITHRIRQAPQSELIKEVTTKAVCRFYINEREGGLWFTYRAKDPRLGSWGHASVPNGSRNFGIVKVVIDGSRELPVDCHTLWH